MLAVPARLTILTAAMLQAYIAARKDRFEVYLSFFLRRLARRPHCC
jgi:hypothetical protein